MDIVRALLITYHFNVSTEPYDLKAFSAYPVLLFHTPFETMNLEKDNCIFSLIFRIEVLWLPRFQWLAYFLSLLVLRDRQIPEPSSPVNPGIQAKKQCY